ncbi:MAG: CDP-glucose 4,6-dehydratase [Nanoarchaeota archaeon]|nr:CDP-glucose 4,6-dehydratase [Nanoarchaeota archaeon]
MNFKDYNGLNVLVTGHTGFKGSWLSIWLNSLGANVIGYSLDPPTNPSNFKLSKLEKKITDIRGDIRDLDKLKSVIERYQPELIFHLAAQPIVLKSYREPKETFDINAGGTVNILESVRQANNVKALVCITTDKCYENKESGIEYREDDRLGGDDPYSSSKAMAELAIHAYRESFFSSTEKTNVASTRAGNVIGGGDFSENRLIPDCVRAFSNNRTLLLRSPKSIRPWQFVLEPISGYLMLGAKLLEDKSFAEAWNFGPKDGKKTDCEEIVQKAADLWGSGSYVTGNNAEEKESKVLRLNSDKSIFRLKWNPVYSLDEALEQTLGWYRKWFENKDKGIDMYDHCLHQINRYISKIKNTH